MSTGHSGVSFDPALLVSLVSVAHNFENSISDLFPSRETNVECLKEQGRVTSDYIKILRFVDERALTRMKTFARRRDLLILRSLGTASLKGERKEENTKIVALADNPDVARPYDTRRSVSSVSLPFSSHGFFYFR